MFQLFFKKDFAALEWTDESEGKVQIDGIEYTVTHPITKFGLFNNNKQIYFDITIVAFYHILCYLFYIIHFNIF